MPTVTAPKLSLPRRCGHSFWSYLVQLTWCFRSRFRFRLWPGPRLVAQERVEAHQGLPGPVQELLPHRHPTFAQVVAVRVPGPPPEAAGVVQAVDPAHPGGGPAVLVEVQPVHGRVPALGPDAGPQDIGRAGTERALRLPFGRPGGGTHRDSKGRHDGDDGRGGLETIKQHARCTQTHDGRWQNWRPICGGDRG